MFASIKELVKTRAPGVASIIRASRSYWTGRRWLGKGMNAFQEIYSGKVWNDAESLSGIGSNMRATAAIRAELPRLLREYQITSIVDAPCGDFYWMSTIEMHDCLYTGIDVVPELVEQVSRNHSSPRRRFLCFDLSRGEIPRADVVMCRDCLVHFSYRDIRRTLSNFRRSGAKFLLTTTYPNHPFNVDCPTGHWRTLNWQAPPFHFPPPLELIWDDVTNGTVPGDKHLGLWTFESLTEALER